jgi:hypothetical protein
MLKRVTIISLVSLLLLAATAIAVEKKSAGKPNPPKTADSASLIKNRTQDTARTGAIEKSKNPSSDSYDDFIDKNNNGIDDRVERRPEKAEKKNEPVKKPVR